MPCRNEKIGVILAFTVFTSTKPNLIRLGMLCKIKMVFQKKIGEKLSEIYKYPPQAFLGWKKKDFSHQNTFYLVYFILFFFLYYNNTVPWRNRTFVLSPALSAKTNKKKAEARMDTRDLQNQRDDNRYRGKCSLLCIISNSVLSFWCMKHLWEESGVVYD